MNNTVTINIDGKEVSVQEARELFLQLKEIFDDQPYVPYVPYVPAIYPQTIPVHPWDSPVYTSPSTIDHIEWTGMELISFSAEQHRVPEF